MLDFRERKDLLFLLIIGLLAILAGVIFLMIVIWGPKEEKFAVGKVSISNEKITNEVKLNECLNRLSNLLENSKYEEIYSLLAKDYIKYNNFSLEKLKEKISSSGIDAQSISLVSLYDTVNYSDFSNVYLISVRGKSSDKSCKMVIREISPRNFDFAFGEFIGYETPIYDQTVENIELNIASVRYESDYVYYNVKITNKSSNKLIFDFDQNSSVFLLKNTEGSLKQEGISYGGSYEIAPNETKDYSMHFNINTIEISDISGLTLRNVKTNEGKTVDILYQF